MIYKHLISIRHNGSNSDFVYAFNKKFTFYIDNFDAIGRYQFLTTKQIQKHFKNKPWLLHKNTCPYLTETIGYFNWEFWSNQNTIIKHQENLILQWLSFTNGIIVNTHTGAFFDFIQKLKYPLSDINKTYGFQQGQVFLSNVEQEYFEELKNSVYKALKYNTKYTFKNNYSTGRNELYIPAIIPNSLLENKLLSFWGFNIDITNSKAWMLFLQN